MSIDGEAWALTYSFLEIEAMMQVPATRVSATRTDFRSPARGRRYYNISFAPTRENHRTSGKVNASFFTRDRHRNVTRCITHVINGSRDCGIRNGFQKSLISSRNDVYAIAGGRLIQFFYDT